MPLVLVSRQLTQPETTNSPLLEVNVHLRQFGSFCCSMCCGHNNSIQAQFRNKQEAQEEITQNPGLSFFWNSPHLLAAVVPLDSIFPGQKDSMFLLEFQPPHIILNSRLSKDQCYKDKELNCTSPFLQGSTPLQICLQWLIPQILYMVFLKFYIEFQFICEGESACWQIYLPFQGWNSCLEMFYIFLYKIVHNFLQTYFLILDNFI